MYQQPGYGRNGAPMDNQVPNAPIYPNAATKNGMPAQKPMQAAPQSNDSDDSYMDIMKIFNNNK